MHLIEVRDVYKIYNPGENQVNALDGVSITIDEGEFVAIIGQSGSGKSTLMNMLGLLDTPTHGEYYINGKLVDDLTDDQMSAIRNEEIGLFLHLLHLKMLNFRLYTEECQSRKGVKFHKMHLKEWALASV